MHGSGTIQILKRDRSVERFDARKMAVSVWRAMRGSDMPFEYAEKLAEAIEIYLRRRGGSYVSSSAVFEMVLTALRHVGFSQCAKNAEAYRDWRDTLRKQLAVRQDNGTLTRWDKSWLCEFARCSWHISPACARIIARQVEFGFLRGQELVIPRQAVVDALNELISQYGLADAVPVRQ